MKSGNTTKLHTLRKPTTLAVATIAIAAIIRFYRLGEHPLFFDESIHATIIHNTLSGARYTYDPRYHGPLLYFSILPVVEALGKSELALRVVPAILGIALVASVFLHRRYIGDKVYIAALFVAISPVIVNYARFCRADTYQLLFVSLAVFFILRYLEHDKRWTDTKVDRDTGYAIAASLFLALFASVKETFYVFAAILGLYLIFDIKRIRLTDLAISAGVFAFVYITFYTNFFTYWEPITNVSKFPAVEAFNYWYGQHEMARIGGPWYYHLEIILLYDFPAFCLALYTIYRYFRGERDEFTSMFIYLFIANLIFYSYMQEKVPWLAVHIEFPMFLLAARSISVKSTSVKSIGVNSTGAESVCAESTGTRRAFAVATLAITTLFLLHGSLATNIVNPTNPAEPALYMPTQYDVKKITANFTESTKVYLYATVGEYHPLVFYLKSWYWNPPSPYGADVVIANATKSIQLENQLSHWKRETMVVRCWTFWTTPDISRLPEFLIFRKPLTDVSCMNFSVFHQ